MEKQADTDYPVLDVVRKRWSPCVYADRPVEMGKLRSLFEAARWAPSCYNEQPWRFVLGIKGHGDAHQRILSCLVDANQEWAKGAPVLGISIGRLTFERNEKPNKEAIHDVGLAMGALILQAVKEGLCVHQMAGFRAREAIEVLEIPEGFQPAAAFAIGYAGDPTGAPDGLRERDEGPRMRKSQQEFVFQGAFGAPFEEEKH